VAGKREGRTDFAGSEVEIPASFSNLSERWLLSENPDLPPDATDRRKLRADPFS
jgi:hypothetical protein